MVRFISCPSSRKIMRKKHAQSEDKDRMILNLGRKVRYFLIKRASRTQLRSKNCHKLVLGHVLVLR